MSQHRSTCPLLRGSSSPQPSCSSSPLSTADPAFPFTLNMRPAHPHTSHPGIHLKHPAPCVHLLVSSQPTLSLPTLSLPTLLLLFQESPSSSTPP